GQPRDGVEQDDDVFLELDQPLGFFDDHLGHLDVAGGGFIEGGGDDLAAHRALHFSDFFRTLVDQQDDHYGVGIIGGDGMRDVLHHHGLARFGAGHDEGALAFAQRREDVEDASGDVLFALDVAL